VTPVTRFQCASWSSRCDEGRQLRERESNEGGDWTHLRLLELLSPLALCYRCPIRFDDADGVLLGRVRRAPDPLAHEAVGRLRATGRA